MTDEKWNEDKYAPHMRMDVRKRNDNIDFGSELCGRCQGTGNELLSMHRRCSHCGGSGIKCIPRWCYNNDEELKMDMGPEFYECEDCDLRDCRLRNRYGKD